MKLIELLIIAIAFSGLFIALLLLHSYLFNSGWFFEVSDMVGLF